MGHAGRGAGQGEGKRGAYSGKVIEVDVSKSKVFPETPDVDEKRDYGGVLWCVILMINRRK
jgi:hypothetical protein